MEKFNRITHESWATIRISQKQFFAKNSAVVKSSLHAMLHGTFFNDNWQCKWCYMRFYWLANEIALVFKMYCVSHQASRDKREPKCLSALNVIMRKVWCIDNGIRDLNGQHGIHSIYRYMDFFYMQGRNLTVRIEGRGAVSSSCPTKGRGHQQKLRPRTETENLPDIQPNARQNLPEYHF